MEVNTVKEKWKNTLYVVGLLVALTIIWASAFFVGRMTVPEKTTTENYSLNLNTETGWNLANDFVEQIVDWNTDGEELAIMTEDDYELYAYKTEDIY